MALNEKGHEVLDTTPIALPVGYRKPPTIQEQIQMYIRRELSKQAVVQGMESFEDADDFDVEEDDEPLPRTQYELDESTASLERWDENGQRERAIREAEERIAARTASGRGTEAESSSERNSEDQEGHSDSEQRDLPGGKPGKGKRSLQGVKKPVG